MKGEALWHEDDVADMTGDKWYTLEDGGLTFLLMRCFSESVSENMRRWAEDFMGKTICDVCQGTRLKKNHCSSGYMKKNISELADMDVRSLVDWFQHVEKAWMKTTGHCP